MASHRHTHTSSKKSLAVRCSRDVSRRNATATEPENNYWQRNEHSHSPRTAYAHFVRMRVLNYKLTISIVGNCEHDFTCSRRRLLFYSNVLLCITFELISYVRCACEIDGKSAFRFVEFGLFAARPPMYCANGWNG